MTTVKRRFFAITIAIILAMAMPMTAAARAVHVTGNWTSITSPVYAGDQTWLIRVSNLPPGGKVDIRMIDGNNTVVWEEHGALAPPFTFMRSFWAGPNVQRIEARAVVPVPYVPSATIDASPS